MHCTIEGISYDGAGVGRIDGRVVFVPFAIPGETVDIEITSNKNRYLTGKLKKVLEKSPDRVEPFCPYYCQCGGCSYQHVNYQAQLYFKHQVVVDNLRRIGSITAQVNDTLGMENPLRYRNKVTWHIKNGRLGYYAGNTTKLVPIKTCPLISERMEEVSQLIDRQLSADNCKGSGEIVIRESSVNGDIMVLVRQIEMSSGLLHLLKEHCSSVFAFQNNQFKLIYGEEFLLEKLYDLSFRLSPGSFFQINHTQTLKLIDKVLDYLNLSGQENLLDGYCGIGSISLPLAQSCGHVTGVESFAPAIEDARINAKINFLENCEFINGPCEIVLPKLTKSFDAVILDPPRSGCKREVISTIAHKLPQRIVYVSCNPATLARDLAPFAEQSYQVKEVQPVDMFPWCRHIETIVIMTKCGSEDRSRL